MDEIKTSIGTFGKFTPIKWYFLILAAITLIFLPQLASATVFNDSAYGYNESLFFSGTLSTYQTDVGSTAVVNATATQEKNGSVWVVRANFTSLKVIGEFKMKAAFKEDPGVFTTIKTNSSNTCNHYTTFTSTVDGQFYGSGQIGWQKTTCVIGPSEFYYDIIFETVNTTYANTLTGKKEIKLNYNTGVYKGWIDTAYFGAFNGDDLSSPTYGGFIVIGANNDFVFMTDSFTPVSDGSQFVSTQFSDTAYLTTQFTNTSNFGYVNLTKSNINYQVIVYNSTFTNYVNDTSTTDFSFYGSRQFGLSAFVNHILSGDTVNRTFFTSGGIACNPAPCPGGSQPPPSVTPSAGGQTNPPLAKPSSGGAIQFSQTKYYINDIVSIQWSIADADWNAFGSQFHIDLKADGELQQTLDNPTGQIPVGSQTGYFNFTAGKVSSLEADLFGTSFVLGVPLGSNTFLNNAFASIIPDPVSYIIVNNTVAVGKPVSVRYSYGSQPAIDNFGNGIYGKKDTQNFATEFQTTFGNNTARVEYTTNVTFPESGNYVVQLKDISKGVVAFANVNAIQIYVPPTQNISLTKLSLDKSVYMYGDVIQATYAIDNFNYSNSQIFFNVSSYATGVLLDNGLMIDQNFNAAQFGTMSVPISPQYTTGLNRFGIWANNGSTSFEIAFRNFTLSSTNARGFGMSITPSSTCAGRKNMINLTIPESGFLTITQTSAGFFGAVIKQYNLTNNTVLYFTPAESITYTFELFATSDNSLQSATTLNPDCTAPSPFSTPIPTPSPQKISEQQTCTLLDGMVGLMFPSQVNNMTRFYFAAFWVVATFAFGIFISNRSVFAGIALAIFPYSFFTFVTTSCGTFIPQWTAIVVAIVIALKLGVFK